MLLEIPPIELQPAGAGYGADAASLLHARVTIIGVDHNLHAISIVRGRGGHQRPEAAALTPNFRHVRAAAISATLQTVRIGNRDYVLVLTPARA